MINNKITKITAILIGTIISIFLIMGGFKLIENVFTRAADVEPRDVVVSELTQSSAKISWATGQDTQGVVEYGTSPTALNFFGPENQMGKSHTVELTLLSPGTTYYFQIRIGEKKYDNGGVPWTFTTKTREEAAPPPKTPTPTIAQTSVSQTPTPTPISSIKIGTDSICGETDCVKICQKINKGCTLNDFVKHQCIGKVNISNCQ